MTRPKSDLIAEVRLPRRYLKRKVRWVWRERQLVMPTNLAAETAVLGAILLDNEAFKSAGCLVAEDFSLDSNRRIFQRMGELMAQSHAVDIVTLAEKMRSEIAGCGGVAYLASLTEGLPRCPVITEYIAILQEKRKLRTIMLTCENAMKLAQSQKHTGSAIVDYMGKALNGITKRR